MNTQDILKYCFNKGLLVDKEVLNLFSETRDLESVKMIIKNIKEHTNQKVITKKVFYENKDKVNEVFSNLPEENRKSLEKLKINLGLSIEISREKSEFSPLNINKPQEKKIEFDNENVKVLSKNPVFTKKPDIKDFVNYFRNRFLNMKNILQNNPRLNNLVSINKLSKNRQGISVIGMVSDKRVTKNKNILLEIEDLTGKTRALINKNRPDLYKKSEEICLDSVVGFKGAGDREIIFVNDVVFPDAMLFERKKSSEDERALFIGDLHFGSKLFLKDSFEKFIKYLNGEIPNTPEVNRIKYLFIVGDIVSGIGNYPSQEKDLEIPDLEEQFSQLTEMLEKIRKDIKIIISPGNHDGVRLMEPQPIHDEKYAWSLYNLKNVILTSNPSYINIGKKDNFSGFDVLTYHGFSYPYYADNIPSLIENTAMHAPDLIMKYLLKNRHLAPTHGSNQYFPGKEDSLMIKKVPDIFVSAHTHKSAVSYYNNVLIISTSSWEDITPYEEKMGADPDFCKVPMVNLKTREVKILDFEDAN